MKIREEILKKAIAVEDFQRAGPGQPCLVQLPPKQCKAQGLL